MNGHKYVYQINDYDGAHGGDIQNHWTSTQANGTIEFWMSFSSNTQGHDYRVKQYGVGETFRLIVIDGEFKYYDNTGIHTLSGAPTPQVDEWYHIRYEFRGSSTNEHKGLTSQYTYKIYINGEEFGPFEFATNIDPDTFHAHTAIASNNLSIYWDAVGYSWDPSYQIGDNQGEGLLLSYEKYSMIEEVAYSIDGSLLKSITGNATIVFPKNGLHSIQLFGNDSFNTQYSSDVIYFTTNLNLPVITGISNTTIEQFSDYELVWTIENKDSGRYKIKRDRVTVDSGQIYNSNTINYQVNSESVSQHNYTLLFWDPFNNHANYTSIAEIVDLTDPSFQGNLSVSIPQNSSYNLVWTITEYNNGTYIILKEGTLIDSGPFQDGEIVEYEVFTEIVAEFNYTIIAVDPFGNEAQFTSMISIIDQTIPVIDGTTSITIPQNSSYSLEWTITEYNNGSYIILEEGIIINSSTFFDGDIISHYVETEKVDEINYTIIAIDPSGNEAQFTSIATVVDTIYPLIDGLISLSIEQSNIYDLEWTITEYNNGTYLILKDQIIVKYDNFSNKEKISIQLDTSIVGLFNYTIIAIDFSGNEANFTTMVNIIDQTDPIIEGLENIVIEQNSINYVSWKITELNNGSHEIIVDGFSINSGQFINSNNVTISIDTSIVGVYNYTIVATDPSGNRAEFTSMVNIIDLTDPIIEGLKNIQIEQNSINSVSWKIIELNNGSYEIIVDGHSINSGQFINGNNISISIDTSIVGVENYTIIATDPYGNDAKFTTVISVIDSIPPQIEGESSVIVDFNQFYILEWNISEINDGTYLIKIENTTLISNAFTDGDTVSIPLDTSQSGYFTYTILATDPSENEATFNTIVYIKQPNPTNMIPGYDWVLIVILLTSLTSVL
ncbi:MAG: hypothetical protein GF311_27660, partial [Candidatus Lokiarchaeota archaeon]|nr:hypothetical protein [Candidatus Lokiarchaeota archaeon]